jgi:hypothetical protein
LQHQREILLHERREAQEYNQELQQDLESLRLKAEQERVAQESIYAGSKIERKRPAKSPSELQH